MSTPYTPAFTHKDIEIIEQNTVFQGYFRLDRYHIRHRLFQGGWSQTLPREVFERRQAAGVLLVDPVLNKIVLIEQFRVGICQHTEYPWLLELVAGIIEPDETPAEVAKRESQEEAGVMIQDLIPIIDYWVSPGASSEKVSLFCARVDASVAGGVHGLPEEGEDIRVWVFSIQEVYEMLAAGQINNAPTLIALQWFKLNEQKVRMYWK